MAQKTIATTLAPGVNIQAVQGSLQVKGWDRSEVLLRTRDESAVLERQDDRILIRCLGDCEVRLPRDASVIATKIHGNARCPECGRNSLFTPDDFGKLYHVYTGATFEFR